MKLVILIDKIAEGKLIDCMYDFADYLICKRDGKPWLKTENASTFRDDIKKMVGGVFMQHGATRASHVL